MNLEPATTKLIEKFKITRTNAGCLEDMACPECGSRGPFKISCSVINVVTDDGDSDQFGDTEWDSKSWCGCDCGHGADVHEFTFTGLDAQLNEQAANRAIAAAKAVRKKSWLRNIKVEDTP